jgi:hypothetical protein
MVRQPHHVIYALYRKITNTLVRSACNNVADMINYKPFYYITSAMSVGMHGKGVEI